jgi:quercetin dioxygenase-like cupin family protein
MAMEWNALRRIITGENENGRSRILIDSDAAKLTAVEEAGLAEIWEAELSPGKLLDATDKLSSLDLKLEPAAGNVKIRWLTVAPEDTSKTKEEMEAAAAFAFGVIGAAHCRVDTNRHAFMHRTDTLDFIILVKGTVDLLLDEGEPTTLKPGDVVIQRATNHAWVNHGAETALLVAVLMNAG